MTGTVKDLLRTLLLGPAFSTGRSIWNACMEMVEKLILIRPETLSGGKPWDLVVSSLYPTFLMIGASLMNLLFVISFFRETADLKHNMTMEKVFTLFIKLIISNVLLLNGMTLIQSVFAILAVSGLTISTDFQLDDIIIPASVSEGNLLTYGVLGILFIILSLICGITMIWIFYKRILNLYILVVLSPIAFSSFAGDRDIAVSGVSWIKSFLGYCLEIIIITLILKLTAEILKGGSSVSLELNGSAAADLQKPMEAMLVMVLVTGAAKGAENLLQRSFHL